MQTVQLLVKKNHSKENPLEDEGGVTDKYKYKNGRKENERKLEKKRKKKKKMLKKRKSYERHK